MRKLLRNYWPNLIKNNEIWKHKRNQEYIWRSGNPSADGGAIHCGKQLMI